MPPGKYIKKEENKESTVYGIISHKLGQSVISVHALQCYAFERSGTDRAKSVNRLFQSLALVAAQQQI